MTSPHLLFFGLENDPHLDVVVKEICLKGGRVTTKNSRSPTSLEMLSIPLGPSPLYVPAWDAVWVRHTPPLFPARQDVYSAEIIQKQRAFRSLFIQWLSLQISRNIPVLPFPEGGSYDQHKINHLHLARLAHLKTPKTLCCYQDQEAEKFIAQHHGDLVIKPLIGGQYAKALKQIELENWFQHYGPLILQEHIYGKPCRAIYIKAQGLFSFSGPGHEEIDWRNTPNTGEEIFQWQPHQLPDALQSQLVRFCEHAQLDFVSLDLILTKNDCYFLEANTTPSWLDLPSSNAKKITQAVANLLWEIKRNQ